MSNSMASLAARFSAPFPVQIGRNAGALLIAGAVGALALVSAPGALLTLALLATRAAIRSPVLQINFLALAGPAFAALIVCAFAGLPGAIGVLFAWRLLADARWSAREAQRLAIAAGKPGETNFTALAHVWTTPLLGLCTVAYTSPHLVMGLPLDLPHIPASVVVVTGFTAIVLIFDWALRRAADWRLGELARAPAAHLLAHHVVFLIAFGVGLDLSAGIVMLLAWRLAHGAPQAQASLTAVP